MKVTSMDPRLVNFIKGDTPPLNPDTANGLAIKHLAKAEEFMDNVMRAVLKGIPDFRYLGGERVTPYEEFSVLTQPRENSRTFDMARSDTYMMRYRFEFKGKEYQKYILLPFVGEAGTIFLRGTKYVISPALIDRVISITPPDVFVRLLRDRLNFKRQPHFFQANVGRRTEHPEFGVNYERCWESASVVRSIVYKQTQKLKARKKVYDADTVLVFYLLCKYGLTDMFKRFMNLDIRYYDTSPDSTKPLEDLNPDEWVICSTVATPTSKPKSLAKKVYTPTNIVIAVPRKRYNETVKSMIAGVYYVLDHFSEEITVDDLDTDVRWRVCMGMALWGHEVNAGKLYEDLTDHIESLDNYIDEIMRTKFYEIGYPIDNIYQLFYLIIEKFNTWQKEYINNESNLYGKELSILYYVLLDVIKQVVLFYFGLTKDSKKGLTETDIVSNLTRKLKTQEILNMYKRHGEISTVNSASDNKIFRITQLLVPQDKTSVTNSNSNIDLNDPSMRLDVSIAEVCTYNGMSKASPDGLTRLNLHLKINEADNSIVRSEDLQEMLDEVQAILINGRLATGNLINE